MTRPERTALATGVGVTGVAPSKVKWQQKGKGRTQPPERGEAPPITAHTRPPPPPRDPGGADRPASGAALPAPTPVHRCTARCGRAESQVLEQHPENSVGTNLGPTSGGATSPGPSPAVVLLLLWPIPWARLPSPLDT